MEVDAVSGAQPAAAAQAPVKAEPGTAAAPPPAPPAPPTPPPRDPPATVATPARAEPEGLTEADAAWSPPGVTPALAAALRTHAAFLGRVGAWRAADLVTPLVAAARCDAHLACHLWVLIFPIVWATLADRKEQQVALAKPLIALLSREHHARGAAHRPNVVQALLEGVSLSQPQPKIPSELVRYLGRSFAAWHVAVPLLESHVALFPGEARCVDALADLYAGLAEGDVLAGLWKKRAAADETRAALSLLQHGAAERAQGALVDALRKAATGGFGPGAVAAANAEAARLAAAAGAPPPPPRPPVSPSKGEVVLWVARAAECAGELAQWDAVGEFAAACDNAPLLAGALAKLHDWARLKAAVLPRMASDEGEEAEMLRACVALQEGAVMEGDARAARAAGRALEAWWGLPAPGARARAPLAATFQRIVELQESTRALVDLGSAQRPGHQYSELKDILETWRLRTPDPADSLGSWASVLLWRNSIYNIVINAFKGLADAAPHLHQLGYRDKAWSVNRLAAVARRHGAPSACRAILSSLYGFSAMEVQEAFVKACEQAKAALAQGAPEAAAAGLAGLLAQNLDYFGPGHQAELFRLRGRLAQGAGDGGGANAAFATSLALWPTHAKAWLSWGELLDGVAKSSAAAAAAASAAAAAGTAPPPGAAPNAAAAAANAQAALVGAVTCYLQALRHGGAPHRARRTLPRILDALALDAPPAAGAPIAAAVRSAGRAVPPAVWVPWLPQLQAGLARPEAPVAKALLARAALAHPQATYYGLRTFLLADRKSVV